MFKKWKNRIIERGKHTTEKFRFPFKLFLKDEITLTREYIFTESCLYNLGDNDDKDINKLFGIGLNIFPKIVNIKKDKQYIINDIKNESLLGRVIWFKLFNRYYVLKPQNYSSFMFGWNIVSEKFIGLYKYCHNYHGGRIDFNSSHITMFRIGDVIKLSVTIDKKHKTIKMIGADWNNNLLFTKLIDLSAYKIKWFLLYLDLWFGGNRPAPHDITIKERIIK